MPNLKYIELFITLKLLNKTPFNIMLSDVTDSVYRFCKNWCWKLLRSRIEFILFSLFKAVDYNDLCHW